MVGVTGSIPVAPTILLRAPRFAGLPLRHALRSFSEGGPIPVAPLIARAKLGGEIQLEYGLEAQLATRLTRQLAAAPSHRRNIVWQKTIVAPATAIAETRQS